MEFFLTGVAETAEQATARDLMVLFDADRQTLKPIQFNNLRALP